MSEYTKVEIKMKDPDCICSALKELGYPTELHEVAQPLYGYQGDVRPERANIIVRRKHIGSAANDIGFSKNTDGTYEMIISEYDRRASHSGNFMSRLKQMYGVHKTKKFIKRKGYSISSQKTDADGKIKIRIRAR
jgi:hypothetical protein